MHLDNQAQVRSMPPSQVLSGSLVSLEDTGRHLDLTDLLQPQAWALLRGLSAEAGGGLQERHHSGRC